jgi:preprotein translocase SecE subunit
MPIINYLKDVRAELTHVTWPSRAQTILYTVVVIVVSAGVAIYLGLWDYLFAAVLRQII